MDQTMTGMEPENATEMSLSDAYQQAITPGLHRIIVQQSVSFSHKGENERHDYYRDNVFHVDGPRYFLGEDDIHSFFPNQGATGNFDRMLPYVVLRKRALPWERSEPPKDNETPVPGMALLLVSEAEMATAGGEEAVSVTTPQQLLAGDRRAGNFQLLMPKLSPERDADDAKTRVRVVDLPAALIRDICPKGAESRLLAHVRRVHTGNKVALGMHAEGEFSVVVGNRIAQPGANHAFLVSLEGWAGLLDGTRANVEETARARMIVLHSWRFVEDRGRAYGFGTLAQRLDAGEIGAMPTGRDGAGGAGEGTGVRNGTTEPPAAVPERLKNMLRGAFVPVMHHEADGSEGIAWYRGPLTPKLPDLDPTFPEEFDGTEQALGFDPDTGGAVLSYAAAWQMGRLLALSSPSFLGATRRIVEPGNGPKAALQKVVDRFQGVHSGLRQAMANDGRATADGPAGDGSASGAKAAGGDTPGKVADADPWGHQTVFGMASWLTDLVQLRTVPFNYLIPDERLLPPESLRFFHIDDAWILTLASGALSLSGAGGENAAPSPSPPPKALRRNLSTLVSESLESERGRAPMPQNFMEICKTGFLLRSELVSGWPGLNVAMIGEDGAKLTPFLFKRLSDNVMIGLVVGRIRELVVSEPPEGVFFSLSGEIPSRAASSRPGIVDIAALTTAMRLGSASEFARKSLAAGFSRTFKWGV